MSERTCPQCGRRFEPKRPHHVYENHRAEQAEARVAEVEEERDEWERKALELGVGFFKLATSEPGRRAERAEAALHQAEQQLRSLLTDLQGEAERIIDSGAWETPAAAAGRLVYLIRKYAALSSTEPTEGQQGGGKDG